MVRYEHLAVLLIPVLLLSLFVGCGGAGGSGNSPTPPTPSGAGPAEVVYVANAVGRSISAFTVNTDTGALTPVPGSPFAAPARPFNMVTLANSFLFVNAQEAMDSPKTELDTYTIERATGALSLTHTLATNPSVEAEPQASPTAPSLFVVGQDNNSSILSLHVSSTGALSPVAGSPFPLSELALGQMALHPNQQFLYLEGGFQDACETLLAHVDPATGQVSGAESSGADCPNEIVVSPSGKFVLVINSVIFVYAVGPTGKLTQISGSPFRTGFNSNVRAIDMDPDGKFVYVTDNGTNQVFGFSMDPVTGALTPVAGNPGNIGTAPLHLAVSRHCVYVVNTNDNTLSVFHFDSTTGALTEGPGSPNKVGQAPWGVAAVEF